MSAHIKEPMVSHGRGGQGNIGPDSTEYVDGEIVREGIYGDQGDGAYSAGVSTRFPSITSISGTSADAYTYMQRGGAGNIGSPHIRPASTPHDAEMVPEHAVHASMDEPHHTGRGGQGNVHLDQASLKDKEAKDQTTRKVAHKGLADKLKDKLLGRK
ncbi:hypothetical protein N7457_006163 [Penicillium paradoxum]|uniref:uncharacterized protein n=1 Tax=Penicillium paradoxum TaxID=176176 RepID=UPI0025498518|nr:uncharacterized protein N7457_006163 [Penicillium paradoxum]KAJ5781003.1 hypothetical protein N7457_006163 [Penicillium paradoxum]